MKLRSLLGSLITMMMVIPSFAAVVFPGNLMTNFSQSLNQNAGCRNPILANQSACKEIEEQILGSTVRIRFEVWSVKDEESGYDVRFSEGHATLYGDRYLVTHNHYSVPAYEIENNQYGLVILSNASGEEVYRGPISDFNLVLEEAEALVFAYKNHTLSEKTGLIPAQISAWTSIQLQEGMEVAQVDWDGSKTRIDWVTVREVHHEGEMSWIVLDDDAKEGASGGGIFWQGIHIGNNWRRETHVLGENALDVTRAALNSEQIALLSVEQVTSE